MAKSNLLKDIAELRLQKEKLEKEVLDLSEEKFILGFGLHKPVYHLRTPEEYKNALLEVRKKQKELIKSGEAIVCTYEWAIKGDPATGTAFINSVISTTLQIFNLECDTIFRKLKFNNYEIAKDRINALYLSLNLKNQPLFIVLSKKYLDLKIKELDILFELSQKRKQDAEIKREQKEILREQAAVEKELSLERERLKKEKAHYQNQADLLCDRVNKELDDKEKASLLKKLDSVNTLIHKIDKSLADVDYRQANIRAGYVYIISNIGSFGDGVYKIGMTRRLNPLERIDELGGASVPFRFDVHALIFSEDAPRLESLLHQIFSKNRVNKINGRKEFFKVPLSEIEKVVKENFDNTIEFVYTPEAEQYRESMLL